MLIALGVIGYLLGSGALAYVFRGHDCQFPAAFFFPITVVIIILISPIVLVNIVVKKQKKAADRIKEVEREMKSIKQERDSYFNSYKEEIAAHHKTKDQLTDVRELLEAVKYGKKKRKNV